MKGIVSIQSHVVYGHAGNSATVFPLQRMGFEVWPIHTVQFSNHTQYPHFSGRAFDGDMISEIVTGLEQIDQLENIHAIISGYLGDEKQCIAIAHFVETVKKINPSVCYFCDPVMGNPKTNYGHGCIVKKEVMDAICTHLMPIADVLLPNQDELLMYVDAQQFDNFDAVVHAAKIAYYKKASAVLVKKVQHAQSDNSIFQMILVCDAGIFVSNADYIATQYPFVGLGDLISAVFMAGLLQDMSMEDAFIRTNNIAYAIAARTVAMNERELQLIAGQDIFVHPPLSSCCSVQRVGAV